MNPINVIQTIDVTVVRIYTLEQAENVTSILNYLQKEIKVRGMSVFRAVSGFGETGIHSTTFLDVSFSLPLIIEFFDHPEKVAVALKYLAPVIKKEHLIFFSAKANA